MNIQTIHHKKNEIFEEEFSKDEECTEVFDLTNAKNLYIKPKNGDCTPIFALSNKLSALNVKARIFTPIWYLGWRDGISPQTPLVTLDDVLCGDESGKVNLSKYIPEDNAVLFLSEDCYRRYNTTLKNRYKCTISDIEHEIEGIGYQAGNYLVGRMLCECTCYTIFLQDGTQEEIQKANEVAKELKEKYGVEEVNLFVLHCFTDVNDHPNVYALGIYDKREEYKIGIEKICEALRKAKSYNGIETEKQWCELNIELAQEREKMGYINKIITTNSTGILPVQDNERLQVIDGKEIFEEYLKTER